MAVGTVSELSCGDISCLSFQREAVNNIMIIIIRQVIVISIGIGGFVRGGLN